VPRPTVRGPGAGRLHEVHHHLRAGYPPERAGAVGAVLQVRADLVWLHASPVSASGSVPHESNGSGRTLTPLRARDGASPRWARGGFSRSTARCSRCCKVYCRGQLIGIVGPLDRLEVRAISPPCASENERLVLADLHRAGLNVRAIVSLRSHIDGHPSRSAEPRPRQEELNEEHWRSYKHQHFFAEESMLMYGWRF
jgi:hypothetical protein